MIGSLLHRQEDEDMSHRVIKLAPSSVSAPAPSSDQPGVAPIRALDPLDWGRRRGDFDGERDVPGTTAGSGGLDPAGGGNVPQRQPYTWVLDLLLVAFLTVLSAAIVLSPAIPRAVVWIVAIPFLTIYPGYAIVAALFPEAAEAPHDRGERSGYSLGWAGRLALSLVLSPIVIAVLALGLSTQSAIALEPAVISITIVTLVGLVLALVERWWLAAEIRAAPLAPTVRPSLGTLSAGSTIQNVVLAVALVALAATLVYAVAVPPSGDGHTEVYLVPNETGNYPETMTVGESERLQLGIENAEHETMTYDVVTILQDVSADGTIQAEEQLDRFQITLSDEQAHRIDRTVTPTLSGEDMALQVLVFEGEAPEPFDTVEADHLLQLRLTVEES